MNATPSSPKGSYGPPTAASSSADSPNPQPHNAQDELSRQPLRSDEKCLRGGVPILLSRGSLCLCRLSGLVASGFSLVGGEVVLVGAEHGEDDVAAAAGE